jgi:hypothetical protein
MTEKLLPVGKWANLFKNRLGLTSEELLWIGQVEKIHLQLAKEVPKSQKLLFIFQINIF